MNNYLQILILYIAASSLLCLFVGCFIGVLLNVLLVEPTLGTIFGSVSYGRLLPVHLNVQLYGWCSLPIIGILLKTYDVPSRHFKLNMTAVTLWSSALMVGCVSWMSGHSSGKIFLEWCGFSRYYFVGCLIFLWVTLGINFVASRRNCSRKDLTLKILLLSGLLFVPWLMLIATDPSSFPPINSSTSGATGASLVISSLFVIFLCVALPPYILNKKPSYAQIQSIAIGLFFSLVIWLLMNHENSTHFDWDQKLGITSLLIWIPLLIIYYGSFCWDYQYNIWLKSTCFWGIFLMLSAVCMFSPIILNSIKFTNGIVAHVHVAMAGFLSSLNFIILTSLHKSDEYYEVLASRKYCYLWNAALCGQVFVLSAISFIETKHHGMGFMSPYYKDLQLLRLVPGCAMAAVSLTYFMKVVIVLSKRNE